MMPTRTPLIAGNWKMHKTAREAVELIATLRGNVADIQDVDIIVCPPFTALRDAGNALRGSNIELGAQDLHWAGEGPYTGEISAAMLWELGCTHVIVGHSERRQHFFETDEMVRQKVTAAFANELTPILCVGETHDERRDGLTEQVVERQLRLATGELYAGLISSLVIAYEPVWAIGSGQAATGEEADRVSGLIRGWLAEWFGADASGARILYGGSVNRQNAAAFLDRPEIDGALVGGASLDPEVFADIVIAAVPRV